jgi:hypothetical protein
MGGRGSRRPASADEIVARWAPEVAALANAVRAQIRGMIDGVCEEGDPAGGGIRFRRREVFAYLAPRVDHVELGFEHGHALPDLTGQLEGSGRARHLALRSAEQLASRELKMLISAALFDDDTHGFRRRARPP